MSASSRIQVALGAVLAIAALLAGASAAAAFTWTPRADTGPGALGFGRHLHAGGVIDNKIYIAGGGFIGGFLWGSDETAEVYNPVTDSWSSLPMLTQRRTAAASAVATVGGEPRLFVIGGMDVTDFPVGHVTFRTIEEYDPLLGTWRTRADCTMGNCMPEGFRSWGAGAVTVDNLVYIMGGTDDSFGVLSARLTAWDPDTDTFTTLAPMPDGSSDGVAVAVGRKIYWISGYDSFRGWGAPPRDTVLIYDIDLDSWTTAVSRVPSGRANAAGIAFGDVIYFMGGWDGSGNYAGMYDRVDAYDTLTDTWTQNVPDVLGCPGDDGGTVRGRSGFTLHVANDGFDEQLYAIGGGVGISVPTRCNESTATPGQLNDPDPPVFGGLGTAAEEVACPDPLAPTVMLAWSAGTDASPPVSYNVYRGTSPAFIPGVGNRIATGLMTLSHADVLSPADCGSTYFYVVRAQDSAMPANEDTNTNRLVVDISCPAPRRPGNVTPALRVGKTAADEPWLDWSRIVPTPDVTHYHVYRSTRADRLGAILYEPLTTDQVDTFASAPMYFYDVRASNDCASNEESLD